MDELAKRFVRSNLSPAIIRANAESMRLEAKEIFRIIAQTHEWTGQMWRQR